jgi:tetratricopeptide (TPR) repeat protein
VSSLSLLYLALALEATGLAALFGPANAFALLCIYFAAHGCASLLVARVMTRFVPQFYPNSERSPFGYFAALGFFVPVLGIAGMLFLLVSARNAPTGPRIREYELVEAPRYSGGEAVGAPAFNRAGIRPVLLSRTAPVELRLKALLALHSVPSRAANNLIREMLREPVDDMRLLAYGLLDAREKVLDARIHGLKTRLEAAGEAESRAPILKELAESYWELVYRGIVQGDLLHHCVAEARRYLGEFLERDPRDPGAWALHGRLLTFEGRDREADEAFGRAVALASPRPGCCPYRAELAFRARDFERVRQLVRRLGTQPTNALAAIARYWNDDGRPAR